MGNQSISLSRIKEVVKRVNKRNIDENINKKESLPQEDSADNTTDVKNPEDIELKAKRDLRGHWFIPILIASVGLFIFHMYTG